MDTSAPINKPIPPSGTNKPINQSNAIGNASVGNKETEVGGIGGELPLSPMGQEVELPKEVAAAGVSVHPTVVQIPQPMSQMGVKPLGQNIPMQPTTGTITLPLTDDQINQGLHQSITSSWRWLAEWCRRRLRQILRGS